jgi:hypothetical protein
MVQLKRRSNTHKFQHLSRDMFNFMEILYEPEAGTCNILPANFMIFGEDNRCHKVTSQN